MSFKLGNVVTWTSQAQGTAKTKTGNVLAIVPPGVKAVDVLVKVVTERHASLTGVGMSRNAESYLIEVPGPTPSSKMRLYWPNVAALSLASKTTPNIALAIFERLETEGGSTPTFTVISRVLDAGLATGRIAFR